MVVSLGPGKFYGNSLPRPRFYTNVKFNGERVSPPVPVNDAFITWANDAHWSMGGLSFTRYRLQGRIEGNVEKLRVQLEEELKTKSSEMKKPVRDEKGKSSYINYKTASPPPAPVAIKRQRVVGLVDEDEEEMRVVVKRSAVRKLGDDFEMVAEESRMAVENVGDDEVVAKRTRINGKKGDQSKIKKGKKKLIMGGRKIGAAIVEATGRIRSSPQLAKSSGGR